MAVELKFTCLVNKKDFISISNPAFTNNIVVSGLCHGKSINIVLDIHTAIKLSKELRTNINYAKEVNND